VSLGCGACNLCCKLIAVPDIGKPAGMTCWNTTIHGGCTKHADKAIDPSLAACASYKCLWLESQSYDEPKRQPRAMRPDQTHVVMGVPDPDNLDSKVLHVHVDPNHPASWREPRVAHYLNDFLARGAELEVHIGKDLSFPVVEPF
jgi:hypothetical protein